MIMGDSDIPEEKLEHANTLGSELNLKNRATPYERNGFKNHKFDRPELDFNKVESTKGGITQDSVEGTVAEIPQSLAQPLANMVEASIDGVNEDVAAVIETTTKASRPT